MGIESWNLELANRILNKNKHNGFLSCITKAERGMGKSMYNLKVLAQVYYQLDPNHDETLAWKTALNNMIFSADDLLDKINYNIEQDIVSPAWCLDDAAVHFSNYLFFIDVYQAQLLNAAFDTIRTVVSGLLLNCPSKERLMSALKKYDDHEVTLYTTGEMGRQYGRKAVCIKYYSLPDGKKKFRKTFEDHFSVYVPTWVYNEYMVTRKHYLKEINDKIRLIRDKRNERMQKKYGEVEKTETSKTKDELFNYD